MISWDNSEEIVHTDDMDDFFNGLSEPERKNKIYRYGAYAAIIIGIWAFFRFLLPLVWPLVLAAAFVVPSASLMRRIGEKIPLGKGMLTGAFLILFVTAVFGIVWLLLAWIMHGISAFSGNLDRITVEIYSFLHGVCDTAEAKMGMERGRLWIFLESNAGTMVTSFREDFLPKMMTGSVQYIKILVAGVAFFLITFVSAVLLAKDYEIIKAKVLEIPLLVKCFAIAVKVGSWLKSYLKAQLAVMAVVTVVCAVGYKIAGVENAIITGLVTGVLDLLPFIGAGIILWPLAIWFILTGEYGKTVTIVLVYLICVFVREFLEPRLLGKTVGFLPVFMLASMYGGVKLYGILGVLLGPLSVLLFREIAFSGGKSVDKGQGKL
ncbi:MAG: AI-2E family transporter [Lachnospiraceae bacterium]|nr:AI-2E family transporter [Lachnospiraceae bacterium]